LTTSDLAAATVTQTNDIGYYQPTTNDSSAIQTAAAAYMNQLISPKMTIYSSDGVTVNRPQGRYCLYEFNQCNNCFVFNPAIECGGKGTWGTILFTNLETTDYGYNNWVRGGFVKYGSFSSVCFQRNKNGGVIDFTPYRCGESGVKTCQNQVSERSSRCYNMMFGNIRPYQTVFDGVDLNADYGTSAERVDDYTLSEYAWHQLPTKHVVWNVVSYGCRGMGVWGDGANNTYSDCTSVDGNQGGINLIIYNSVVHNPKVINCNKYNVTGQHQMVYSGGNTIINNPYVWTSSDITVGNAIYITDNNNSIFNETILGSLSGVTQFTRQNLKLSGVTLGTQSSTETDLGVDIHPRGPLLTNACARVGGHLQLGTDGAEVGYAYINGMIAGTKYHGVYALPQGGGTAALAVSDGTTTSGILPTNSEMYFRQNSTTGGLELVWKNSAGTSSTTSLRFVATKSYDWPSLATGSQQSTTVTLTGAVMGQRVLCSINANLQGTRMWAEITSTDTVTVYHRNDTGSTIDVLGGTIAVSVIG